MVAGENCQRHFVMPTHSAPPEWLGIKDTPHFGYQGYLDLHHRSSSVLPLVPVEWGDERFVLVGDFKSTGAWAWKKTADDLKTDVQSTLYAKWASTHYRTDTVDLAWIYVRTKEAPKCEVTYLRTTSDTFDARFEQIERIANDMFVLRWAAPKRVKVAGIDDLTEDQLKKADPSAFAIRNRNLARIRANPELHAYVNSLPKMLTTCGAYGNCPFSDSEICHLNVKQVTERMKIQAMGRDVHKDVEFMAKQIDANKRALAARIEEIKDNSMGIRDRLAAKKAAAEGTAPTPAPAPINPPESALPPKEEAPIPDPPATVEAAPKAKVGRPKKAAANKAAPTEQATESSTTTAEDTYAAPSGSPATKLYEGRAVRVTYPSMKFSENFNTWGTPELMIESAVAEGETPGQAIKRIHLELKALINDLVPEHKATFDRQKAA
jgi:hypothetical protein